MDKDQQPGFNIGLDKPETNAETEAGAAAGAQAGAGSEKPPIPPSPKHQRKTEKPKKQRDMTLTITCLGFLVLALVLGYIYYDIQDRMQTINTSGSEEVARLSRELSNNMADLENQLAALKKATQKQVDDARAGLENTDSRVNQLQERMTAFEKNIGSLQKALNPLKKQVEQLDEKMSGLIQTSRSIEQAQGGIQDELDEHSDTLKTLSAELDSVSGERVSPDMLNQALEKEREFYKENMAHTTETLFSEISSLKEDMRRLAENIENQRIGPSSGQSNDERDSESNRNAAEEMQIPAEGGIIEQEIE